MSSLSTRMWRALAFGIRMSFAIVKPLVCAMAETTRLDAIVTGGGLFINVNAAKKWGDPVIGENLLIEQGHKGIDRPLSAKPVI